MCICKYVYIYTCTLNQSTFTPGWGALAKLCDLVVVPAPYNSSPCLIVDHAGIVHVSRHILLRKPTIEISKNKCHE